MTTPATTTETNTPEFRCELQGTELHLWVYGVIGADAEYGISAMDVARELNAHRKSKLSLIVVHIHSAGGSALDGMAISNLLAKHVAPVLTINEGLAASAATPILLSGDRIECHANAMVMIHQAASAVFGGVDEMEATARVLRSLNQQIVNLYVARTGKPAEQVQAWMDAETWFSADEALEAGFVTRVIPTESKASEPNSVKAAAKELANRLRPISQSSVKELCLMAGATPSNEKPDLSNITLQQLQEQNPQLITQITNQVKQDLAAQNPAPATDPQLNAEILRREGAAAEAKRQSDIRALCNKAGMPDLIDGYCRDPQMSVNDVQARLFGELCNRNQAPQAGGGEVITEGKPKDPADKFRAEYKENRQIYEAQGITEDQYVASRKKDPGED